MIVIDLIKNKGASLLEVLISVAILSITILTFATVQISSLDSVRDGYVKKIITEAGNEFIIQFNTDMAFQKNNIERDSLLDSYLKNWNLEKTSCPVSGTIVNNCISTSELDNESLCSKENRIEFDIKNFQCDLYQSVPSAKTKFAKCDSSTDLHCLTISWNGDQNTYSRCKEYDSNCIIFEVLP